LNSEFWKKFEESRLLPRANLILQPAFWRGSLPLGVFGFVLEGELVSTLVPEQPEHVRRGNLGDDKIRCCGDFGKIGGTSWKTNKKKYTYIGVLKKESV